MNLRAILEAIHIEPNETYTTVMRIGETVTRYDHRSDFRHCLGKFHFLSTSNEA